MQVASNYGHALQRFTGMVRIVMQDGTTLDVSADAVTLIESSNLIVDDGLHPRRLLLAVARIEEIPEGG